MDVFGKGGQRWAQDNLHWNRGSIRKGREELFSGLASIDRFSERGRKKTEVHHQRLLDDIKAIVEPVSHADPTFRTTRLYIPITASSIRQLLIENMGYSDDVLPGARTLSTKLNRLGYYPQKVAKTKPLKKIPETDEIFRTVHQLNRLADQTPGVLRLSMDAKAAIKVGAFSRGGRSRSGIRALDHDFKPDTVLSLLGFLVPTYSENYFCFTEGKINADFMVDALERIWPRRITDGRGADLFLC